MLGLDGLVHGKQSFRIWFIYVYFMENQQNNMDENYPLVN
jgi:hypothetical protein